MISQALLLPDGRYVVPGNRWDLVPETTRTAEPDVSVIIPYYQARPQLDLVLEALRLQDYPADRFEIVVADDGSRLPLELDVAATGGQRIRVVRQRDQGFRAAAARNLAAGVAEGGTLCFLDQDTVPEPSYLRALTRLPALLPDALVVGRRRHAQLRGWTPPQVRSWLTGTGEAPQEIAPPVWLEDGYRDSENLLRCDERSYRYIISAVMCCSAVLFAELGGFDESFTSYGGEDWELAYRAWNAGAVLAHEPRAVAWHDGPDWAGRGDTVEQELVKAKERQALARLIPRPDKLDDPDAPVDLVDLVVTWTNTSAQSAGELTTGLRELLSLPTNLGIYLDPGETHRIVRLPTAVRARVHVRPVPPEVLARARYQVTLSTACAPAESLSMLRELLDDGRAGRVRLREPAMVGLAQRAARRAARWQSVFPDRDLITDLFGDLPLLSLRN